MAWVALVSSERRCVVGMKWQRKTYDHQQVIQFHSFVVFVSDETKRSQILRFFLLAVLVLPNRFSLYMQYPRRALLLWWAATGMQEG